MNKELSEGDELAEEFKQQQQEMEARLKELKEAFKKREPRYNLRILGGNVTSEDKEILKNISKDVLDLDIGEIVAYQDPELECLTYAKICSLYAKIVKCSTHERYDPSNLTVRGNNFFENGVECVQLRNLLQVGGGPLEEISLFQDEYSDDDDQEYTDNQKLYLVKYCSLCEKQVKHYMLKVSLRKKNLEKVEDKDFFHIFKIVPKSEECFQEDLCFV